MVLVVGMFAVGLFIQHYFSDVIELIALNERMTEKAEIYVEESNLSTQTATVFGIANTFIVDIFYVVLSLLVAQRCRKKSVKRLLRYLEPFAIAGMMFAVLSIPVALFYRIVHFYWIYLIILMADYFMHMLHGRRGAILSMSPGVAALWIFPFFFLVIYGYLGKVSNTNGLQNYDRYMPYSSVITKKVLPNREALYKRYGVDSVSTDYY